MKNPIALIIRPTQRCNFKCTFCSADELPKNEMSANDIISYIKKYLPVQSISFAGGDPLCVKPEIYENVIAWVDSNLPENVSIHFTSNLWDFYKRPDKWLSILKHPRVNTCTSFQYGSGRRISKDKVFDEETFLRVYYKYKQLVNKSLSFIAVINEENEDSVLETIKLAKRIGTTCKINPEYKSGLSSKTYPFYKIIEKYADAICKGYAQYEDNCLYLISCIQTGQASGCPFNKDCANNMRCINQDGTSLICSTYSIKNSPIHFYNKNNEIDITKNFKTKLANSKCLTCENYNICNSCALKVDEIQNIENIDLHCKSIANSVNRIKDYLKDNPL